MAKRVSKSALIREWIRDNPEASEQPGVGAIIAKKFKCSPSLLTTARKSMKPNHVLGNPVPDTLEFEDNIDKLNTEIQTLRGIGLIRVKRILDLLN